MSDAQTASRREPRPGPVAVNTDLFLNACRAKGAVSDAERAALLGRSRKTVYQYAHGKIEPKYYTAVRIAALLEVDPADLWPGTKVAA